MRHFSFAVMVTGGLSAIGACSLINAPADVVPEKENIGGAGGFAVTTHTSTGQGGTTHSSSSHSSTHTSTGSVMVECHGDTDCKQEECKSAKCENHKCVVTNAHDSAACDDGNKCTLNDRCTGGVCGGDMKTCAAAADPCQANACDPATGACKLGPGMDGTMCDDGDPCTGGDACMNGKCQKGTMDACKALSNDCNDGVCMPGMGCVANPKPDLTGCGMSNCSTGQCKAGHCNITFLNQGMPCDDGLFCTINEICNNGTCIGIPNPCATGNACIKAGCDEDKDMCTATKIPDNSPCDDGNACTANEFCSTPMPNMPVCQGGLSVATLFFETFANNSQNWTLGPEWQIGPPIVSMGEQAGIGFQPDPAADYQAYAGLPGANDGVAGVEIGGNASLTMGDMSMMPPTPVHAPFYLTSPPVATMVAGQVYLTFYRHLESDQLPYMRNMVEVSKDGMMWTPIWNNDNPSLCTPMPPATNCCQSMGGCPFMTDGKPDPTMPMNPVSPWVFESYDVTMFKSPTMQFRFGFAIESGGVYTVPSWTIDYVKVQNAPCPN
jgi:hypothetical protein